MRLFTVHTKPAAPDMDSRTVFVREGFAWAALLVPALWLIYHRLWLALVGYFLLAIAISAAAQTAGLSEAGIGICSLLVQLAVAFEANDIRRWTLERQGYRLTAIVAGANQDEAERRYFAQHPSPPPWPGDRAAKPPAASGPVWPKPAPSGSDDVLGLFPRPLG